MKTTQKRLAALAIGGAAVLMTGALAPGAWLMPPDSDFVDYTKIPAKPGEIGSQLKASALRINAAIQAAEKATGGIAKSAMIRFNAEGAPEALIVCYTESEGRRLVINAKGEVIDNQPQPRFPGAFVAGEPTMTTDGGVLVWDIKPGEGAVVTDSALLTVNFTGWLVDGRQWGSSADSGGSITVSSDQVFPGWAEGMAGMKAGGTRKLCIPGELAFGEEGAGPAIPPNAVIIMDVELVDVSDYSKVPDALPGEPVRGDMVKTDSGLMYYDLVVGDGAMADSPSDTVTVHYTGWLNDGAKFDSSHDRQQPATFRLDGVIAGWTEGVQGMKVGGKRKLIIPFDLAYGPAGRQPRIPPRALLIFDIELLNVGQ